MAVYLGLDASTQSLTATLIEVAAGRRDVIVEDSLVYDRDLPAYVTSHGVIRPDDPAVVVAPPVMWAEALDVVMARLARTYPAEMARLAAVSGSAQQHGSVYLTRRGIARLGMLDARLTLASQIVGAFARPLSPVWMDSSTTVECREIEDAVGGAARLAAHTGAHAFERFTGPQIRAFAKRDPRAYAGTSRIHLISSFMPSLLAGAEAPIDPGDGSGMNLMELTTKQWWDEAVRVTAPDLAPRLPGIRPSWTVVGTLAPYWQQRCHLPSARVIAWSGDNPCSLIGSGLVREGRLAISLGTSDTAIGLMAAPRVDESGIGYVSASPTGEYMGTTVFKNGSLARERIRDQYGLDWASFSAALLSRPPGNDGAMMLPWFDPEITPHVISPGVRRIDLDPEDAAANVRAVVEAQMMAMANHTRWMGVDTSVVHATGGAAGNRHVLQVMADVFGAEVVRSRARNSASLGAALRAWHADALADGRPVEWEDVIVGFTEPEPEWRFRPRPEAVAVYVDLRRRYAETEATTLRGKS
ncbi:MAG TPA: FGGY-family carbohydrate kinase [Vicinamibacterales bacterium]|nr:FGGY-family carbohydrate kinase [Vicinamibacterales bacterium]